MPLRRKRGTSFPREGTGLFLGVKLALAPRKPLSSHPDLHSVLPGGPGLAGISIKGTTPWEEPTEVHPTHDISQNVFLFISKVREFCILYSCLF